MGEVVLNRFRIESRLGDGGFGTVYSAWDERLQRPVAVKAIPASRAGERFDREARASARLNHRGIVTLFEVGRDERRAYLVSELVEGWTLREHLAAGTLSDRDVALIGAELCDAIEHAHRHGVVHRDVKPENVMVRADGVAKLMDFGVARIADAAPLTRAGDIVGTIAYMSPEQANGEPVDGASDVYSLALVLYEAWAGRNPVARSSPAATAMAITAGIPSLAEPRPGLPSALTEAIDLCLEADTDWRPPPADLAERLREVAPALDDECAVPLPEAAVRPGRHLPTRLIRVGVALVVASVIAALAAAGQSGTALLAGLVLGPPALLLAPRDWIALPAAPLLGALGLATAACGLAAAAESGLRRAVGAASAFLGTWCVATVGDVDLLGFTPPPPPAGWERSVEQAGSYVLDPLVTVEPIALAAAWIAGAVLLGRLLAAPRAVAVLGAIGWAAALVSVERLLVGATDAAAHSWLAAALLSSAVLAGALRSPQRGGREHVVPSEPERLRPLTHGSPKPA